MEITDNIQDIKDIDKSLKWYFHPSEIVRMLRYFHFNSKFDNNIDYTPHYTNNPKIGVVIGTYGCTPYIELQLYFLKYINKIKHILIHDDCSPYTQELLELSKQYNVDFYSTKHRLWHKTNVGSIGDTNAFYYGLQWAKVHNIDILVKLSRRLIPCFEWTNNLINLAKETDATTFGSYCTTDPFNLRTEGIALNVEIWTKEYPMFNLAWTIQNEYSIFAEFWMHEMAKTLSGNNYSEKWFNYVKKSKNGYLHSGYAIWKDILGTNRFNSDDRAGYTLWHKYSSINDYLNVSKQILGNKYTKSDFENCENF